MVYSMRLSSWSLRIIGLALFAMGLIVVSMAFISSEMDGYIMIFPFVFGNLKGLPAIAITLGCQGKKETLSCLLYQGNQRGLMSGL